MARFAGCVGYGENVESPPSSGIWIDRMYERPYTGKVVRNVRKSSEGEGLNNNLTVTNSISIVADPYAVENYSTIKYVEWAGTLWSVTSVAIARPRLTLTLGEVYNGPTA